MDSHHYRYLDARRTFLELAVDAEIESRVHPLEGPDGDIAMDIAIWGNGNATKALVLSSGTHGVEGYCGSFIQCQFLLDGMHKQLPDDLMLVMIHGVNPHGFAWQRRVNEDNIDLNRNFADHSTLSQNQGYAEIAAAFEPLDWHEESSAEVWQTVAEAALSPNLDGKVPQSRVDNMRFPMVCFTEEKNRRGLFNNLEMLRRAPYRVSPSSG
jgi:hypothetical protein